MVASGILCLGPAFFATASLSLTIVSTTLCSFATVGAENFVNLGVVDIGLYCFTDINGDTQGYDLVDAGQETVDARVFAILAAVFGGLAFLFYICACCKRFGKHEFKIAGGLAFLACFLQGLVFLFLKNHLCHLGCKLAAGGNCAIAACVLWFVTCVFSCVAGKDEENEEEVNSDMREPLSGGSEDA